MRVLFAHISWMPEYSGDPGEPLFSTHGWVVGKGDAHERANFKAIRGRVYGYVPVREKLRSKIPGNINLEKLGADKASTSVSGVTVIWFANNPDRQAEAYIVGWYRNATVYRELRYIDDIEYRIECRADDAILVAEGMRDFRIPHVRSLAGQAAGYGYGQSSLWYAEGLDGFKADVALYIDSVEHNLVRVAGEKSQSGGDAINDLDDMPIGNASPQKLTGTATFFPRDSRVRQAVVARSKGFCEYCGELGFERLDGSHFIEAHHIISLAEQGPDTMANVIALCPNHHRQAHFGRNKQQLEAAFLTKLSEIQGA